MTEIYSCQQQLFWSLLHRSAAIENKIPKDQKKIFISSKLFEDVPIQGDGWSPDLTQRIYNGSNSYFERLSNVLHGLADLGYQVTVLTESSTWKWAVQGSDARVDSESRFLNMLLKNPNISLKSLSHLSDSLLQTPVGSLKIKSTLTSNEFFGRSFQSSEFVFVKSPNNKVLLRSVENLVSKSTDYNTKVKDIGKVAIPNLAPVQSSNAVESSVGDTNTIESDGLIEVNMEIAESPLQSPEKYVPSTPQNYTPAGIDNPSASAMERSVTVQCNKLAIHLRHFLFNAVKSPILQELSEQNLSEKLFMDSEPTENHIQFFDNIKELLDGIPPEATRSLREFLYMDDKAWLKWNSKFQSLIQSLKDVFHRLSSNTDNLLQLSKRIFTLESKFKTLTQT
jgi:hypothetical protein